MRPKARLRCAKMPVVCRVLVVCIVTYTPKSRFRSLLPWRFHLMSIPRKWSTGLDEGDNKLQTTEDTHKPFGISLTTEWTGYSQITHTKLTDFDKRNNWLWTSNNDIWRITEDTKQAYRPRQRKGLATYDLLALMCNSKNTKYLFRNWNNIYIFSKA